MTSAVQRVRRAVQRKSRAGWKMLLGLRGRLGFRSGGGSPSDGSNGRWCIVTPPHTLFIAHLIASRLADYGLETDVLDAPPAVFSHEMYVVLCAQIFDRLPPGERRIIFQLEQSVSSRWFSASYFRALADSRAIFDYSLCNVRFLSSNGLPDSRIHYVPIGACVGYKTGLPVTEKLYEVLFYGDAVSSPRRRRLLSALRTRFQVRECSEIFGDSMAIEIRRARLVVNLHFYENAILETPRISECLSLGVPVVSESARDQADYPEFGEAVSYFEEGNESAMLAAVQAAFDRGGGDALLKESVALSSERFNRTLDRALVALELVEGNVPSREVPGGRD